MNIRKFLIRNALPAKVAHFFVSICSPCSCLKNIPNTYSSRYMKKNFKT